MKSRLILVAVVIVAALAVTLSLTVGALALKPISMKRITEVLQVVFVLALCVERGVAVFVEAWRGPAEAAVLSAVHAAVREVELVRARLQDVSAASAATTRLELAEDQAAVYAAHTRKIQVCAGIVAGVLISAAGVRLFEEFVVFRTPLPRLIDHVAAGILNTLNVLITGALIGGGSDLIHKILKALTDFLDATSRLNRARASRLMS